MASASGSEAPAFLADCHFPQKHSLGVKKNKKQKRKKLQIFYEVEILLFSPHG